ncbi:PREDICTED: uncharacterized protein LOC108567119 [Nicrophorus vespilloides]|uniref:Uncharacterized protein LOC108567119 n=1 Tax=Nicrophorus vespilloides TaxID=110193 RepID=A0ABM1N7T0_NICVS|nr:PREDICTED: uncharacterized protein LOC108567119 [Nicrophorus vespilloides]
MDEDDHDELLQCSDEESMSESGDDQCIPIDKPENVQVQTSIYTLHTKTEFILIKFTLILTATALLILLPLFQESINIKGSAFLILNFTSIFVMLILLVITILCRRFCKDFESINVAKTPLKVRELVATSLIYVSSGFIIIYAVDRKKVMCHLQDPIKGLVLVFSLIYYFFFCKKLMGLQRIFSTTTIIVGLFISVDYGLCDEFRCRGNDREHKSDDAGFWKWQIHSIWAGIYIVGLALFSAFYMLLDRYLICSAIVSPYASLSSQLLTTVSRLVSFQSVNTIPLSSQTRSLTTTRMNRKVYSAVHLSFWLHGFTFAFTVLFFWIDMLPNVGKSDNIVDFLIHTNNGLKCIFNPNLNHTSDCGNTSLYAWLFLLAYLGYFLSSIRFLILSQSAVYTIATTSVALPMVGIWWSLFKMCTVKKGLLIWAPTLSGELICALLGLPIVLIGLALLCKSHFKDCHLSRISSSTCSVSTAHLA